MTASLSLANLTKPSFQEILYKIPIFKESSTIQSALVHLTHLNIRAEQQQ